MSIKKQKLSSKIAVYYSQLPTPELLADVVKLFGNGTKNSQVVHNFKLVKKNYKDRCREIYILQSAGEIYYVKKFYPLTLKERLKYRQISPRALKCFFLSYLLLRAGFTVPEPVVALTYRRKLFQQESIFIAKEYHSISLEEFIGSEAETATKSEVMFTFAQTLGRFYSKGFIQTDPNFGNFLLDLTADNYRFVFIDIDAIIYKPYFSSKDVFKSIAKCFSFFYCSLAVSKTTNMFSAEKLGFLIKTVLHTYNPQSEIEALSALIKERIKLNLQRWNHHDYLSLID